MLTTLLLSFVLTAAAWIAVAVIPWRPVALRVALMIAPLVATTILFTMALGSWDLAWSVQAMVLGPGAVLAALRLLADALDTRDASGIRERG